MCLELEKVVEKHEERLNIHDREIGRLDKRTIAMQEQINSSLVRVDESNRFLREQNMKQMEQNNEILNAVLNRNSESDRREDELKKLNAEQRWKFFGTAIASGGILAIIVNALLSLIK